MDIPQIKQTLQRLFFEDQHRLIFWHDPEGEFIDSVPELAAVELIRMDEQPALGIKIRIEREQPQQKFLLYSPTSPPEPENDWFLDCRYFSHAFNADRASIILDELGLKQLQLHAFLTRHKKFFASKERLKQMQGLVNAQDGELALRQKMLAVALKAEQAELPALLLALFSQVAALEDLIETPPIWQDLIKYELDDFFWNKVFEQFAYTEAMPSLHNLLIRFFVTDFAYQLKAELPQALKHLLLPEAYKTSVAVFLAQWRDSSSRNSSYDILSARVADTLKLTDYLTAFDEFALADVQGFLVVEKQLCQLVRNQITLMPTADLAPIIHQRLAGYWCAKQLPSTPTVPRSALHAVYQALLVAIEFFNALKQTLNWQVGSPEQQYQQYCEHHYRYDQYYRLFSEYADHVRAEGWDILKDLRAKVENFYSEQVLLPLSLAWDGHLSAGLLNHWTLADTTNQQNFFKTEVKPLLDKGDNRKVFVIISDALRYEVAEELTEQLNGQFRFQATLDSLLGVLPSYTALGMAALLPHEQLGYTAQAEVLLDGRPCATLEQRQQLLAVVNGCAIKADDFIQMKKDQGREFIRPARVIYIYHNVIDAVGDTASTESDTFNAVRKTLHELAALTRFIINSLNGTHVLITADHGFLYQEKQPDVSDKSRLAQQPATTIKAKKRYLLGQNFPDHAAVWHGSTQITANALGDMEFWLPKGCNRFHFVGGARFFHGGAMPQEFIVPLVKVQQIKGKSAEKTKIKTVPVHILGSQHKITTNPHRFQLIQTESVSERVKPVTLQIALYENDTIISSIETISFNSQSSDMNQRSSWVSLSLQNKDYSKTVQHYLILRNAETGVEEQRVDVVIDLTVDNDFE